jgi:hypothetical protein
VDGQTYSLDGVGFKDHSAGARDWQRWHSHTFMLAVMPGYVVHAVTVAEPEGGPGEPMGVVKHAQEERPVEIFASSGLADALGGPHEQEIEVTGPSGPVRLRAELLHVFPITISEDNDNFNGIDWEMAGDPIVMLEGVLRLTDPDGKVGHANFERSARRSALARL